MKKNLNFFDRLIRLVLAMVLVILYYLEVFSGTLGIIASGVAIILTLTSLFSFCPLYSLFGVNTRKKK